MLFLKRRMCSSRVRACIRGVGRVSPRRHGVNMRCILGGGGLCARTKRDFYVFRKIHPGRALIRAGYSRGPEGAGHFDGGLSAGVILTGQTLRGPDPEMQI